MTYWHVHNRSCVDIIGDTEYKLTNILLVFVEKYLQDRRKSLRDLRVRSFLCLGLAGPDATDSSTDSRSSLGRAVLLSDFLLLLPLKFFISDWSATSMTNITPWRYCMCSGLRNISNNKRKITLTSRALKPGNVIPHSLLKPRLKTHQKLNLDFARYCLRHVFNVLRPSLYPCKAITYWHTYLARVSPPNTESQTLANTYPQWVASCSCYSSLKNQMSSRPSADCEADLRLSALRLHFYRYFLSKDYIILISMQCICDGPQIWKRSTNQSTFLCVNIVVHFLVFVY